MTKEKELTCVWNMGYDCSGDVTQEEIMDKQISVPVCELHLKDHKQIMFLHKHGEDVEKVLMSSPEERQALFDKIRKEHPDEELDA